MYLLSKILERTPLQAFLQIVYNDKPMVPFDSVGSCHTSFCLISLKEYHHSLDRLAHFQALFGLRDIYRSVISVANIYMHECWTDKKSAHFIIKNSFKCIAVNFKCFSILNYYFIYLSILFGSTSLWICFLLLNSLDDEKRK